MEQKRSLHPGKNLLLRPLLKPGEVFLSPPISFNLPVRTTDPSLDPDTIINVETGELPPSRQFPDQFIGDLSLFFQELEHFRLTQAW